jgi:glycosyltransferase involved in cell wall biosynthesis
MQAAAFESLPELKVAEGAPRPRICIATWELEGLSRNAGIGTAYTSMADALKRANFDVSILFLLGYHPTDGNISDVMEYYRAQKGIEVIPLPMPHHPRIHAAWASSISYFTYLWLKEHEHDYNVIHFPECQGLGFYCQLAKRQGLAFRNTTFVIGAHGPTFWAKEASQDFIPHLGYLETDFMERVSIASADMVVCPSQYLLRWMQHEGWELPKRTYVAPNIRPFGALFDNTNPGAKREIREIVFFGRLELRKGLKLFCDAIDELCADPNTPRFEVTFLGRETFIYGRSSFSYISERSSKWTAPWHIVSNKFQAGAIEYLRGDGRLAVIPSLADNSPNTVLECVSTGLPFLASNVGGIPEIIALEDREKVCFEPRPGVLAQRLRGVLEKGAVSASPCVSFSENEQQWMRWHAGLMNSAHVDASANANEAGGDEDFGPPLVSVCFPYNVREKGAAATLASLKRQDYRNFEVILIECGSHSPSAASSLGSEAEFKGRTVHRIRQSSPEIGTGRNAAAAQAKGKYLLFLDDHCLLFPTTALSVLVNVAERVKADVVTSALSFCFGSSNGLSGKRLEHSRRPFLGGDVATGAYVNCACPKRRVQDSRRFQRRGHDGLGRLGIFIEGGSVGIKDRDHA